MQSGMQKNVLWGPDKFLAPEGIQTALPQTSRLQPGLCNDCTTLTLHSATQNKLNYILSDQNISYECPSTFGNFNTIPYTSNWDKRILQQLNSLIYTEIIEESMSYILHACKCSLICRHIGKMLVLWT
jgi:hypothetical protein